MKSIGFTFYSPTNDFVQIAISETFMKDDIQKMVFYTIGSKNQAFKTLTNPEIEKIHDILKGFSSYKDVQGSQNKSIMGLKAVYIEDDMWEKISKLIKTDK